MLGVMATLVARDLEKIYTGAGEPVAALRRVSLTLEPGEFVAIMGPSGCGKSTLLHLCGAMDRPTRGSVRLGDQDLSALDDGALTRLRRESIGFVFQFFNLLPMLTVRENIALPLLLGGTASASALDDATRLAQRVGLDRRLDHRPSQLSGGEMQRAAIARALVHRPILLVADEPTGNLDSANGARTLELLAELHRETQVSILLATHADEVAARADRIVRMKDGQIEREERVAPRATVANVADVAGLVGVAGVAGAADTADTADAAGTAGTAEAMPGGRSRS
jgi:putative ABC transport system ATP-binding protein